jgi:hypothetical protein
MTCRRLIETSLYVMIQVQIELRGAKTCQLCEWSVKVRIRYNASLGVLDKLPPLDISFQATKPQRLYLYSLHLNMANMDGLKAVPKRLVASYVLDWIVIV